METNKTLLDILRDRYESVKNNALYVLILAVESGKLDKKTVNSANKAIEEISIAKQKLSILDDMGSQFKALSRSMEGDEDQTMMLNS